MNIKPIALFVGATLSSQALALDEPIVITASRTAQTVDQSLASVTIITREDIAASQAKSVTELINSHMGIDTTNRGGYGKSSSLFIRGTNTGHVLVLIDGMQIGSATLGQTELEYLPVAQIERIEIVRGPRSSLYGSEAIGGVIQIFTRQGQSGYQTQIEVTAGSNNFKQSTLSTSGGYEGSRYSLTLSALDDGGFDAFNDSETDDDGYKNQSGSLRLGHTFANGFDVDGNLMRSQGDTDYDGSWQNSSEFKQQIYGLTLSYPLSDSWYSKLVLGNTKDELDSLLNGTHVSTFTTKRQQFNWQNDIKLNQNQTANFGIDYKTDKVESDSTNYTVDELDNVGVYAQLQGDIDKHNYSVSLRNDDNEAFGNEATGNLAWAYALQNDTRLMASYGTAFKAPSFGDLYDPWGGNPDLKPQESNSVEIGLRQKFETSSMELNIYQTNVDNLIEWQSDTSGNWAAVNVEKEITGIELRYTTLIFGWNNITELSWVDPRDKDSNNVSQLRAQHSARIALNRDFGKTKISINTILQGKRYTDAANTSELGGYGLINISGSYALSKQWRISSRIQNLADKEYQTVQNYNTAGRTFFVSIAYDMAN